MLYIGIFGWNTAVFTIPYFQCYWYVCVCVCFFSRLIRLVSVCRFICWLLHKMTMMTPKNRTCFPNTNKGCQSIRWIGNTKTHTQIQKHTFWGYKRYKICSQFLKDTKNRRKKMFTNCKNTIQWNGKIKMSVFSKVISKRCNFNLSIWKQHGKNICLSKSYKTEQNTSAKFKKKTRIHKEDGKERKETPSDVSYFIRAFFFSHVCLLCFCWASGVLIAFYALFWTECREMWKMMTWGMQSHL